MPAFGAKDVQELRKSTGAGMMDAKRALTDADGDFEAATQILREKGLAKAAGRSDRDNREGVVAVSPGRTAPRWSTSSPRPTSRPSPMSSRSWPRSWPSWCWPRARGRRSEGRRARGTQAHDQGEHRRSGRRCATRHRAVGRRRLHPRWGRAGVLIEGRASTPRCSTRSPAHRLRQADLPDPRRHPGR